MRITIKLFAFLQTGRFDEETRAFNPGTTVEQVMKELGISDDQATLVFVNGRHVKASVELNDGDTLALFPPIGGG
ncbi:MAG: ThiS family protein [Syntrophorhabdaceae bacterium PtaU1.Bin034]|nr:MAG: ThiS family protein [Syntrophorhabdaceae bacterium PtaU1.Bin034]